MSQFPLYFTGGEQTRGEQNTPNIWTLLNILVYTECMLGVCRMYRIAYRMYSVGIQGILKMCGGCIGAIRVYSRCVDSV